MCVCGGGGGGGGYGEWKEEELCVYGEGGGWADIKITKAECSAAVEARIAVGWSAPGLRKGTLTW